jgi:lysophospholipase L1-like esterase
MKCTFVALSLLSLLAFPPLASSGQAPANLGQVSTDFAVPTIQRDAAGKVTLTSANPGVTIRYTLDGTDVVPKSGPYLAPINLAHGGVVKARAFSEDRKLKSELVEAKFDPLPGVKVPPTTLVPLTQDRDWPIYDWAKRHTAVTAYLRDHQSSLVFLGDSITQMFGGEPHDRRQPGTNVWDQFYGKRNAGNLGFGYDFVENTLWRLQQGELDGAKAKVVVIHIGTNNAGKNSVDEIVAGIRAICDEVHRRQPQAKILLMGIMPRGPKPDAMRTKLADINQQLAAFDGKDNLTFLDIGAKLLEPDGTISREVMSDFLHPTAKGYQIWAEAIEPLLSKWLGETK